MFSTKKVWEWMCISEATYDKKVAKSRITRKCVFPGCRRKRRDAKDMLCFAHRGEYNGLTFVPNSTKKGES